MDLGQNHEFLPRFSAFAACYFRRTIHILSLNFRKEKTNQIIALGGKDHFTSFPLSQ